MDIPKEREAFEALQNQKIFKWFEFDSSVNAYVLKDISASLEKLTALAELNYGWDMWQAAKAQAIPDGYKVVPVNYECAWCGCTELDGWTDEAMIEAQEPAND